MRRAVRTLGAQSAVDFRKDSYSEAVQDFSAVVDTLGRETEGAQRILKEAKGAAYVSLQPKVLKVRFDTPLLRQRRRGARRRVVYHS